MKLFLNTLKKNLKKLNVNNKKKKILGMKTILTLTSTMIITIKIRGDF